MPGLLVPSLTMDSFCLPNIMLVTIQCNMQGSQERLEPTAIGSTRSKQW